MYKRQHLDSFAELFLPKCTLGEMISKYMVLVESEQKLLIMRPYQIYAVKAIVNCIHQNRVTAMYGIRQVVERRLLHSKPPRY